MFCDIKGKKNLIENCSENLEKNNSVKLRVHWKEEDIIQYCVI